MNLTLKVDTSAVRGLAVTGRVETVRDLGKFFVRASKLAKDAERIVAGISNAKVNHVSLSKE
jgi:hypothetical protein